MTLQERKILAQQPILWTGNLNDDCKAVWAGLMLRAEWMDEEYWWWAVYDLQNNENTVDSSNEYDTHFRSGEVARSQAEKIAQNYIGIICND